MNFEQFVNSQILDAKSLYEKIVEFQKNTKGKMYLFLDEIQEVEGWEKCINSCRVDFDCDIYISGSNAKLLSGELAYVVSMDDFDFSHNGIIHKNTKDFLLMDF